jgi:hypothetical protein
MRSLPPEIMAMIWEYATVSAVLERLEDLHTKLIYTAHIDEAIVARLHHPLRNLLLVDHTTKQETQRISRKSFPFGYNVWIF